MVFTLSDLQQNQKYNPFQTMELKSKPKEIINKTLFRVYHEALNSCQCYKTWNLNQHGDTSMLDHPWWCSLTDKRSHLPHSHCHPPEIRRIYLCNIYNNRLGLLSCSSSDDQGCLPGTLRQQYLHDHMHYYSFSCFLALLYIIIPVIP